MHGWRTPSFAAFCFGHRLLLIASAA
jgi:hypothetical protein